MPWSNIQELRALWYNCKSPLSPIFNLALSTKFSELSDWSKNTEVIPETPWNSTSSLNVETPVTFNWLVSVVASTKILSWNVETPVALKSRVVVPPETNMPSFVVSIRFAPSKNNSTVLLGIKLAKTSSSGSPKAPNAVRRLICFPSFTLKFKLLNLPST